MKFLEKVRKVGKRAKLAISTAIATMSMAAIACVASASETGTTVDTDAVMKQAGDQLTNQFSSLVSTVIPVILGILGSGLVIFGIIKLVKLAKKIFGNVAG